jgi:hypothetical protein
MSCRRTHECITDQRRLGFTRLGDREELGLEKWRVGEWSNGLRIRIDVDAPVAVQDLGPCNVRTAVEDALGQESPIQTFVLKPESVYLRLAPKPILEVRV